MEHLSNNNLHQQHSVDWRLDADIISYEFFDFSNSYNLRLRVTDSSYENISGLASFTVDYTYYATFLDPHVTSVTVNGQTYPRDDSNRYLLFTGVQSPDGTWLRRNSYDAQNAYIKAYYLYEFLYKVLGVKIDISTEVFARSLQIDGKTLQKVNWRLHQDNLLWIDTSKHTASVRKKLDDPSAYVHLDSYHYKFVQCVGELPFAYFPKDPSDRNKTETVDYATRDVSTSLLGGYYGSTIFTKEIKTKTVELKLDEYLYNKLRCIDAPSLIDFSYNFFGKKNSNNSWENSSDISGNISSIIIPGNKVLACQDYGMLDGEEVLAREIPKDIYAAPYEDLELRITGLDLLTCGHEQSVYIWFKHHREKARVTSVSRLYHPFHGLARAYRKKTYYNGSPLMEAADIHNCFYTLMALAIRFASETDCNDLNAPKDSQLAKESEKFSRSVREGTFYESVMDFVNRDAFAPENVPMNNGEYVFPWECPELAKSRSEIKLELQSYRNITNSGVARHQHPVIDDFFVENYPAIRDFLFHYDTETRPVNGRKKKVKLLQADMCRVETYLISSTCFAVKEMGITPFSLHDGIYVSENEMDELKKRLRLDTIKDAQDWILDIFWDRYDALDSEKMKELIGR